jgi:hypothetical protein
MIWGPYDYVNLHNKHIPHRFPKESSANPGVQMIFVPINTFILQGRSSLLASNILTRKNMIMDENRDMVRSDRNI